MKKICTVNDTVTFEYDTVQESIRKVPIGQDETVLMELIFTSYLTIQEASSFIETKKALFNLNNINNISTSLVEDIPLTFSKEYKYLSNITINYDYENMNNVIIGTINFTDKQV